MLSISWTNRGSGAPGNDPDGFIALFGSSAGLARQIVDRAIDDWEAVIQNFNYSGGGNIFNLQVTPAAITAIASAGITNISGGKPTSATISLRNVAATHWLDPTPLDDAEFNTNITNVFTAFATGISGTDLYATMIHEIGHAVGISQQFPTLSIASFITDTGIDDPNTATAGNLLAFNVGGGPVEATFTASDPGHIWEGPATAATNAAGLPVHADDLMNSGRAILGTERNLISDTNATILQLAYGYTVAMPSTINNMLVNGNFTTNTLSVLGGLNNADDTISIAEAPNEMVLVTIGSLRELVPMSEISSIVVDSGGGDDTVRFSPLIPPLFPTPVITANLGAGTNTLEIVGAANAYDSFTLNNSTITSTGINITGFSGAQSVTFFSDGGNADVSLPHTPGGLTSATIFGGSGSETINLHRLDSLTPVTIDALGGNDTINIAPGGGVRDIESAVTISGGVGNDTINLAPNGGTNPIDARINVFGNDGSDTLNLTGGTLSSLTALVTFDGGGGGVDTVVVNDQANSGGSLVTVTAVAVSTAAWLGDLDYSNLDTIVLNLGSGGDTVYVGNGISASVEAYGNNGSDNFIVGGGNLSVVSAVFDGGDGADQITFDNHLDATNRIWDIRHNEVIFGIPRTTAGFESVGILGGTGQDEFAFQGVLGQSFNVDGGLGTDSFILGFQNSVFFSNAVTLLGGDGGDIFTINDAAVSAFTTLSMDGGDGFDLMTVNEPLVTNYIIGPGYFTPQGQGTFGFGSMNTTVFNGNSSNNLFTIYSAGFDFGTFTINGGIGNDTFNLAPQPSGYTFRGLTLNGNQGTDAFTLNASALTTDESYTIGTNTIQIARGLITETITSSSLDQITLSAGSGNDTITIHEYFAVTPVTINGGMGDDTFEITPVSKNLAANISGANTVLTFHGDAGYDTIGVHNENNNNGNSYTIEGINFSISNQIGFPSFAAFFPHTGVESTTVTAGPQLDGILVLNTAPDTFYDFDSGPGAIDDFFAIGFPIGPQSITSVIRGGVRVSGTGGGNDTVDVYNTADTVGRTLHIENGFVGRLPGDNLFGAGGYLEYVGIAGSLTIKLGGGGDVVYATPHAVTPIIVQGNNPTAAPGDKLNLDLSTAQNYVVNGTPASGNVTSSNLRTLSYTGFETGPVIVSGDFDGDGVVNGRDFLAWQRGVGMPAPNAAGGDADDDQDVDGNDLIVWQNQFGNGRLGAIAEFGLRNSESGESLESSAKSQVPESGSGLLTLGSLLERETASDERIVFEDFYTEEVDRALEELATVPRYGVREFGEIAVRRGVPARVVISVEFASEI